ncbi:MAG: GNAT family N-acetyltransferase [Treponema sp.]|nr:GNAT family N-acetyltransferase [Treponema sp.]
MNLIPIETPEDFSLAQQFVIPHEEVCVSLASLVRRKTQDLFFISNSNLPIKIENILGIISLESTVYFCIPNPNLISAEELAAQIQPLLKKEIKCISGEYSGVELLTNVSSSNIKQTCHYKMMVYENNKQTEVELSDSENIIRCTENDIDNLTSLQKDYMKNEIVIPGKKISDAEAAIMLRQILKNQLCLALICDGDFVAKANTNAIGINYIQIGGVYTHPLYRKNGYASALVKTICNRAIKANKKAALFVKEKNMGAFSIYQKHGFTECAHYAIAYF